MAGRVPRTNLSRYPAHDHLLAKYVPVRQRATRVKFPLHPAIKILLIALGAVLIFACSVPCLAAAKMILR
jgi:hypothetical protein